MKRRGKARRSLELIAASLGILAEIQPATVRAVCYRLFSLGLIDSMSKNDTNRVGRQLVDARESGEIPWAWIVDEHRDVEAAPTWANPGAFADAVTASYRRNKWAAQPVRVEVWSEKGTVRGTLAPVLRAYEVPFRVFHGFSSATSVNQIAEETQASDQPLVALYCGDHDPSGLYMSERDLPERLVTYGVDDSFELVRVALTHDDVGEPGLPSFPLSSKRGDSRWAWYAAQGWPACWELDALSPVVLRARVAATIAQYLDRPAWDRYVYAEQVERASILETVGAWRALSVDPARRCAPGAPDGRVGATRSPRDALGSNPGGRSISGTGRASTACHPTLARA